VNSLAICKFVAIKYRGLQNEKCIYYLTSLREASRYFHHRCNIHYSFKYGHLYQWGFCRSPKVWHSDSSDSTFQLGYFTAKLLKSTPVETKTDRSFPRCLLQGRVIFCEVRHASKNEIAVLDSYHSVWTCAVVYFRIPHSYKGSYPVIKQDIRPLAV